MDQDKQPRRVKVTEGGTHRTGTRRAAIKPHKREEASAKQIITTYMNSLKQGSTSQTFWGDTIDKNAAALRANFGLAATDVPYLLLDPTAYLAGQTLAYQRNTLAIGQNGITTRDGQALLPLLQQLQTKLAK